MIFRTSCGSHGHSYRDQGPVSAIGAGVWNTSYCKCRPLVRVVGVAVWHRYQPRPPRREKFNFRVKCMTENYSQTSFLGLTLKSDECRHCHRMDNVISVKLLLLSGLVQSEVDSIKLNLICQSITRTKVLRQNKVFHPLSIVQETVQNIFLVIW